MFSTQQHAPQEHDLVPHTCPQLAWLDDEEVLEEALALSDAAADVQPQWAVTSVCGFGNTFIGEEFQVQPGDVWACFGNVLLAKRDQELMLCRNAPFSQMLNFQCFSYGHHIEHNHFCCES